MKKKMSRLPSVDQHYIVIHVAALNKDQLISKYLFGVITFFKETNEDKSTSRQVLKLNLFVRFLEETLA